MQEWKQIKGFKEHYFTNEIGEVKSTKGREKILKADKNNCYKLITEQGERKSITIPMLKKYFKQDSFADLENLEQEEWKWIDCFGIRENAYQISNKGRVKSFVQNEQGKLLSMQVKEGYVHCQLINQEEQRKSYRVHRLVAAMFIPNPLALDTVNHKNFNKQDNTVENLEWMSMEDNIKHYLDNK